jgi:hypothetical protein
MDTFQYQLDVDQSSGLIRVWCDGMLELKRAKEMVFAARAKAIAHDFPLIYDFRQLVLPTTVPLAIVATFPLLVNLPQLSESLRSAAIVDVDQDGHEVWESYRMASRRSGMHWNYFLSKDEALSWVQERNQWDIRRSVDELKFKS